MHVPSRLRQVACELRREKPSAHADELDRIAMWLEKDGITNVPRGKAGMDGLMRPGRGGDPLQK